MISSVQDWIQADIAESAADSAEPTGFRLTSIELSDRFQPEDEECTRFHALAATERSPIIEVNTRSRAVAPVCASQDDVILMAE